MTLVPEQSPRLLTPIAWVAVIGLATTWSIYPALRPIALPGSNLATALMMLQLCFTVLLWVTVVVDGLHGAKRWTHDSFPVRLDTTIFAIAILALVGKSVYWIGSYFGPIDILTILRLSLSLPYSLDIASLTSVFCLAVLIAIFVAPDRNPIFEAIVVPGLAFIFPLALTGDPMGADSANRIANWSLAAGTVALGLAFAITRDRLHLALIAGVGSVFLQPIALFAVLVAIVALFAQRAGSRAQAAFATGADHIAWFGAGLGLVVAFSGFWFSGLSPTLRSQIEIADLVLTMRPLLMIMASCAALFVLCMLTSPIIAFSLLAAVYLVPIVGTLAFEIQCSVIGGSVPIAIAATIVRAEWHRKSTDERRRRVNLLVTAVLFVIGCICAAIPHPPNYSIS